jgi:hypothetical protein
MKMPGVMVSKIRLMTAAGNAGPAYIGFADDRPQRWSFSLRINPGVAQAVSTAICQVRRHNQRQWYGWRHSADNSGTPHRRQHDWCGHRDSG